MRYAIGLEYDGSAFQGWQSQPHGATVQDHLETALSAIAGAAVRATAAGRTDAGVHAVGQVVHFDTHAERPEQAWVRGVNSYLPEAIAVQWVRGVGEDFHARFGALSRSYRYVLVNRPVRPAIERGKAGWYHQPVDAVAMAEAARFLLGEQDFSSFRTSECQAKSPVKTMHRADVMRQGDYVIFDFRASGFLHHMVRNIVAALLRVGAGKQSPAWLQELIAVRDRTRGAPTFPPDGLYFTAAEYDPRWQLPSGGRIIRPLPPHSTS